LVISRTPLRISLVGGGSDLVSFARVHGGAVVSTAIDRYVYVIVTGRFHDDIRVSYSTTEIVESINDLQHELIREAMRLAGIPRKVEIVTIADVPARGTGLGSSSAVTVGALNALFAFQGISKSARELAEAAAEIEIAILGKPIGKQDQYACAFGGLQLLRFGPGEAVTRDPIVMSHAALQQLQANLLMFYTGHQRSAAEILQRIDASMNSELTRAGLERLRDLALEFRDALGGGSADVGAYLHRGWEEKRRLSGVTNERIDGWYEAARAAGASGGKLLGAGGGGFLLFYVPREHQPAVRHALQDLREMPVALERSGSTIVHID
jgi:D-glycero-alpha-D-manno-heptose-7-phosphate kinase